MLPSFVPTGDSTTVVHAQSSLPAHQQHVHELYARRANRIICRRQRVTGNLQERATEMFLCVTKNMRISMLSFTVD